jgi:hypothetical protein
MGSKLRVTRSVLLLGCVAGCVGIDTTGAGTAGTRGTQAQNAGGATATVTGIDCTLDAATGITLCARVDACTGVRVDPDQFPNCGFRATATRLDLECLCDNALCPIGAAKDCNQARDRLATGSALAVCTQVSDGLCLTINSTRLDGTGGSPSSCDKACAETCAGVLDCPKLCGC